jgi:4-aminobutyrate--pyruvate transaminase
MPFLPNSLEARDVESLVHPYTNLAKHAETGPLVIDRGEGIHVWDTDGNRYIEGVAGLWCASLGYGETELVKAATAQMEKLAFSHLFQSRSHGPVIELAEKLKSLAPCETARVFFVGDGSSANDTAVKLIWYYNNAIGRPEKKKIIGRMKAYHGVTVASASITGLTHNHLDWDLPLKGFLHTDCPHYYREGQPGETEDAFVDRIIGNLERLINKVGPETVAAFFAEPIQGAGGLIVPPRSYFPKLQAVLRKYDIILVADEVITGFLRTGNYWGSQTVGMEPDMVTCAKALSSAYLPIGAVTIPTFMHEAMVRNSAKIGTFGHGNTYSGHPVCAAVALRTLQLYEERDILGHVRSLIPRFQQRLAALADHPLVGEARLGAGLMGGVELVEDKATRKPFDPKATVGMKGLLACQKEGLMVRAVGDVIILCPPLIITEPQIDEMFDRLKTALDGLEV